MTGAKTNAPGVSLADYADPATRAQDLLDTISIIRVASRALEDITVGYGDHLPKQCKVDLQLVVDGLKCAHKRGRIQTTKVSPVPSLLAAYDMRTAADREEKGCEAPPRRFKGSTALWEVKQFVDGCKEPRTVAPKRPAQEEASEESPPKKQRRSERTVTPEKSVLDPPNGAEKWNQRALFSAMSDLIGTGEVESFVKGVLERGPLMLGGTEYNTCHSIYKLFNAKGFTGKPPNGKMKWEKETLAVHIARLESETVLSVKAFIRKVLEVGKTDYRGTSGVYKMYNAWKANGKAGLRSTGRPRIASLAMIDSAVQDKFDKREGDSSAFKLKHMKEFLAKCKRDKAEADGLDPGSVDDRVSDRTAKKAQIAAAMRKNGSEKTSSLTNKSLMTKTEPRWRAEHSVQGGYAYALTVLSTHFCEGPCPPHLAKQFKYDELSPDVKETYEMVKKSLDAEEIHPVDPNLVISTDDTTLFVFEGCSESDEWEWKLVDVGSKDSVRSDFEVGNDAGNSGGLRVRLTFSMTASGLYAPLYVSATGLTEEELSPELCPEGILAEKCPKLCKGGNDVFSTGFGWLVFLRADKKRSRAEGEASNANKKFVHYNQKVLLPFIREIRKELGWSPGQPIPEWLKACCWFDGDIPQLQTMLYEASEALDEAENIIRNKHSAAATGTQQPCDLSPVFKLLKWAANRSTATDSTTAAVAQRLRDEPATTSPKQHTVAVCQCHKTQLAVMCMAKAAWSPRTGAGNGGGNRYRRRS